MPAKLEEIEGRFQRERFRKESFVIGEIHTVDRMLTIKGEAEPGELASGGQYRFYGRRTEYKGEPQFSFNTFVPCQAHDKDGIIEYLFRAGTGFGMGRGTARKCWDAFGTDAVREIRQAPRLLRDINSRITDDQCDQIGEILVSQKATEDATIELTNLLAGRGFPKTTPRKAIRKWGNRAAEIIRKDPYCLMLFRGCGFKLCDSLWLELGHRPDRLRRQALCAWHSVASNTDGHTCHPAENVAAAVRSSIGSANAKPKKAIQLALRLARISPNHYGALAAVRADGVDGPIVDEGGSVWIAEGRKAQAEADLSLMVTGAVGEAKATSLWPDLGLIVGVDEHQRQKLDEALSKRVAILGGSPGTGKTYATAMLIRALIKSGVGADSIAIGAPTGKAAVRITEAMQAAGVNLNARTLHSMLGVGQADTESGDWGFLHNKSNPWQFRVLIIDETSMADTALLRAVFAARPRGCHVLLVGDVHQLPPVGSGAPLRDMINSGVVGYGELTEIKRNSGGIVEACASIRDGKVWSEGDNLVVNDNEDQIKQTLATLQAARGKGFDPVWDCQVLCAVNAKSPLSRKVVNKELQAALNSSPEVKGTPFRLNDKIVCLKNGRYTEIEEDEEVYVANGELAKVIEIEEKSIIAQLWNPGRMIRIPRGKATEGEEASNGCSWDLAYGLSTHKSQGSEWPVVIVLLDEYPGAKMVCSREWLYTAISRAKEKCILIGKKATADAMCRRVAIGKRKTFLRQLIQLENAKRVLEEV